MEINGYFIKIKNYLLEIARITSSTVGNFLHLASVSKQTSAAQGWHSKFPYNEIYFLSSFASIGLYFSGEEQVNNVITRGF